MSYKIDWKVIYEDFKEQFPLTANDVVEVYPCGGMEIAMWLSDGTKVLYNYLHKTRRIMKCKRTDDIYECPSEEDWKSDFAVLLTKKMRAKNINQKELASLTGLSSALIGKYTRGESTPGVYNLMKIANALECFPTELIDFNF